MWQNLFRRSVKAAIVAGVLFVASQGANAGQPHKLMRPPSPMVTLYRGVLYLGSGCTFDAWIKWDTARGKILVSGKMLVGTTVNGKRYEERLVISEYEGRLVNGNTLELRRSLVGKSGLDIDSVMHFRPRPDGTIYWDATYTARNRNVPGSATKGSKTGIIRPSAAPWKRPVPNVPPIPGKDKIPVPPWLRK